MFESPEAQVQKIREIARQINEENSLQARLEAVEERREERLERAHVEAWKLFIDYSKWMAAFALATIGATVSLATSKGIGGLWFYVALLAMTSSAVLCGAVLPFLAGAIRSAIMRNETVRERRIETSINLATAQAMLFIVGIMAFLAFAISAVNALRTDSNEAPTMNLAKPVDSTRHERLSSAVTEHKNVARRTPDPSYSLDNRR